MSIFTKARELADELAASDELRRVKECELKMLIDLPARGIVETYQQIQMEAINAGIPYEQLDEDKKNQLTELEDKMKENAVISEYMQANEELNKVLETINSIISSALNDNSNSGTCSSCSSAGQCGESDCCSSCGGAH